MIPDARLGITASAGVVKSQLGEEQLRQALLQAAARAVRLSGVLIQQQKVYPDLPGTPGF